MVFDKDLFDLLASHQVRKRWENIGFTVSDHNLIHLNEMTLRLQDCDNDSNGGVLGWCFNDNETVKKQLNDPLSTVAGIPLLERTNVSNVSRPAVPHRNGVYEIDHIAIKSTDWDKTKTYFNALGLNLKKEIVNEDKNVRLGFYRPSKTIIEVISSLKSKRELNGNSSSSSVPNCEIWGLTFTCHDIDAIHELLPKCTKAPYAALQPGRTMTVLDTIGQGIPVRIAFMSPHVRYPD